MSEATFLISIEHAIMSEEWKRCRFWIILLKNAAQSSSARYAAASAEVLSNAPAQAFIYYYFFNQCSDVAVFQEKVGHFWLNQMRL